MTDEEKMAAQLVLEAIGMPKPKPRDHRLSDVSDLPWTPFQEGTMPPEWEGQSIAFVNSRYQVFMSKQATKHGDCIHLSIKTHDRSAWHDWRDLQRIKNEILGPEYEGFEVFPAESRLVDTSNQFHLWCFPKGVFEFGFGGERTVTDADGIMPNQRQRPFEK